MFHPYRRTDNLGKRGHLSATRSTLRNDTEGEDIYLRETVATTSQAIPMPNLSKRPPRCTPVPSPAPALTAEGTVTRDRNGKESANLVLGAIDEDSTGDKNSITVIPKDLDSASQSSTSRHRRPRALSTTPTGAIPDPGATASFNDTVPSNSACSNVSSTIPMIPGRDTSVHLNDIENHEAIIPRSIPHPRPLPYAPVGSVIAVRTSNFGKQRWNVSGPGVVLSHNLTDYFVGKKIFSYVVIVGTPVGDVVSQFAPYYGEVGRLDAGQAVFPHLGHQDIVKRKEELYTVYARVFPEPQTSPNAIWQKARVISRPREAPIQVRLLYGPFIGRVYPAINLLPYTQDSESAIRRGGDEWKKVVVPSQILR